MLAGFTTYDLAEATGLNFTYISKLENGKANPTESAIRAIAKALKVNEITLLYQNGIMPKEHQEVFVKLVQDELKEKGLIK